ncbi:MAG: FG-GAP repeat protein, partial [Candidatus Moraniibacteriota bacterium]
FNSSQGKAYIFYNDSSFPTSATNADVAITGETTNNSFSISLAAGDFNADNKTDLAVGASTFNSSQGKAYIFYNDEDGMNGEADQADKAIEGEGSGSYFGSALTVGDFNYDSRADLVVSAPGLNGNIGRVYIFYNDGTMVSRADMADTKINGALGGDQMGAALNLGDFNGDKRMELVIGEKDLINAGGFYIYQRDAAYTVPDRTETRGDVELNGSIWFR